MRAPRGASEPAQQIHRAANSLEQIGDNLFVEEHQARPVDLRRLCREEMRDKLGQKSVEQLNEELLVIHYSPPGGMVAGLDGIRRDAMRRCGIRARASAIEGAGPMLTPV